MALTARLSSLTVPAVHWLGVAVVKLHVCRIRRPDNSTAAAGGCPGGACWGVYDCRLVAVLCLAESQRSCPDWGCSMAGRVDQPAICGFPTPTSSQLLLLMLLLLLFRVVQFTM
jgi:hypothetical protein